MSDIVERLRGPAPLHWEAKEAADLITALRAENERLRAVIDRVYHSSAQKHIIELARAALEEKQ